MKKISVFILLILAGITGSAQKGAVDKKNSKEKKFPLQLENTLLWEISGNHLAKPSYLFGTMHLLCAADAQLSDSLRFSIASVKQIYFEIDLNNMMANAMGIMKVINMNNNIKLSDLLSADEYDRVKDYFKKNSVMLPFSMLERMKPYFITALISESKFPCAEKDGMEQVIMKEAKKDNKPTNGLETVEFQASVFDSIPYKRQAKDLIKMIDSSGVAGSDSSDLQLADVYRKQDLNKMQELTADEEGMGEYLDLLLYSRNRNWVKKMPAIMHDAPALFAVGAGHLGGEMGVINLLRKAGFIVRPVKHKPGLEMEAN
ncbi:MAG: TraB/GumN family protein [Bacteroidota bacterium]